MTKEDFMNYLNMRKALNIGGINFKDFNGKEWAVTIEFFEDWTIVDFFSGKDGTWRVGVPIEEVKFPITILGDDYDG